MANRKGSLTASNIRYLIAIRKLCDNGNGTRCVRIAEVLGVSKPSVHTMINSLKELDLVRKDRYGEVFFTEEGSRLANIYTEYYETVRRRIAEFIPNNEAANAATCAVLAEVGQDGLENMISKSEMSD